MFYSGLALARVDNNVVHCSSPQAVNAYLIPSLPPNLELVLTGIAGSAKSEWSALNVTDDWSNHFTYFFKLAFLFQTFSRGYLQDGYVK